MKYQLSQGDIVFISFNTTIGNEQKGMRPALIVSNDSFHKHTKMGLVCPITNANRGFPAHIALDERTVTTGVVMCEQVKCIDIAAREVSYKETAPNDIVDEVVDLIISFIE